MKSILNNEIDGFNSLHSLLLTLVPLKFWPNGLASSHKLNLHRDLCCVAKWTPQFPRKYTQVAKKKKHLKADISYILGYFWMLTWVGWPNGEKLASTSAQI